MADKKHYPGEFTVRLDENDCVCGFGVDLALTNEVMIVTADKLTLDGRDVVILADNPVDSPMDRIRTLIEQHPRVFGELNGECPYQRAMEFLESMTK